MKDRHRQDEKGSAWTIFGIVGLVNIVEVHPNDFGVMAASYADLVEIDSDAEINDLNARAKALISRGRVNEDGFHIVVPMLRNGFRGFPDEESFRCYLWFLEAQENERSCVLIDVMRSRLSSLRRLRGADLEKVVVTLLGELRIETVR